MPGLGSGKKALNIEGDLDRVNTEILRQLDQGLFALDRANRHLCLECRAV